ncbi:hypothetical protein ACBY01_04395 [Sphingomonas sp. ac-8]|uniref:hypothetical protein n=1 Tax=Sphingomonas sp. ac-8 TaxID=3242977 RepID=UPI003A800264
MKTPYDTALRARQREVDDLRTSIGTATQRLAEADAGRLAITEAMVRESRIAAGDWTLSAMPYLARARAERERLAELRRLADAELEALRHQAIESYGSLRALEGAADGFREQADRAAAGVEQASVDDFAGARFARTLHLARQARARDAR